MLENIFKKVDKETPTTWWKYVAHIASILMQDFQNDPTKLIFNETRQQL